MNTEEIVKKTEDDFTKAWEEYGELNMTVDVRSRTARFFFFAGAEAGIKATNALHERTYGEAKQ